MMLHKFWFKCTRTFERPFWLLFEVKGHPENTKSATNWPKSFENASKETKSLFGEQLKSALKNQGYR